MSQRAKRSMAAAAGLAIVAAVGLGITVFLAAPSSGGAAAQALPDVGRFRVGSALGLERGAFSGRPMVQVFTSAAAADWLRIALCLQSAEVEAEMGSFTGVLVDEDLEPEVERVHRERDGLRVVVRNVAGGFAGCLPAGFECGELVELLRSVRAGASTPPQPSPIYSNLLERPEEVAEWLAGRAGAAEAAKQVDFLEELEGAASPAVQAAKARLGR
jgi:hypothetical protein